MAGVHRPRERVGGGTLPGPVLNVARSPPPPSAPLLPGLSSFSPLARCMLVYAPSAQFSAHHVHPVPSILQSALKYVHIMHESTDTANHREGTWTPTPLPSTSSGRWSLDSS